MPRQCPACHAVYGDSLEVCPRDETSLEPLDPDEDPLVGEVIDGRFRLEALLGAGGMGRVYRGTQLSVDREVAIKLLRGEAVPDEHVKRRFIREARVISGFSHPNIVRLIDFGTDPDREFPYLVMEMAGGVSLGRLLADARLQPAFATEIARQICTGLLEAHDANIVHRDLKPDNLHLVPVSDGSFRAKLLDFGIAFPQEATTRLTETGMMCGTATYMAPEQARGHDVDGQADLYSLGVVSYEMLTGVLPFQGDSGFEIVMKHVEQHPPPMDQYLPPGTLPEALAELVYDLLEKKPRDRPSGPGEVRDRLEAVADELDAPPISIDPARSGAALYEPWLRPALPDEAPIHSSDTLAGDAEVPSPRERAALAPTGDSEPPPDASAPDEATRDGVGSAVDADQPRPDSPLADGAAAARAERGSPGRSSADFDRRLVLAASVFAAVALLGVGGLGAYLVLGGGERGAASGGDDEGAPTAGARGDAGSERAARAGSRDAAGTPDSPDADRRAAAGASTDAGPASARASASAASSEPDEPDRDEPAPEQAGPTPSPSDDGARAAQTGDDPESEAPDRPGSAAGRRGGRAGEETAAGASENDSAGDSAGNAELAERKDDILEQCRSAYRGIQENSEQMQAISSEGDAEKTRAFAEKMKEENREYSQQMREAGDAFAKVTQRAHAEGLDTSTIQRWSKQFAEACQGN